VSYVCSGPAVGSPWGTHPWFSLPGVVFQKPYEKADAKMWPGEEEFCSVGKYSVTSTAAGPTVEAALRKAIQPTPRSLLCDRSSSISQRCATANCLCR
jgi:hypothetical protein